jgi:hypothetical protein
MSSSLVLITSKLGQNHQFESLDFCDLDLKLASSLVNETTSSFLESKTEDKLVIESKISSTLSLEISIVVSSASLIS